MTDRLPDRGETFSRGGDEYVVVNLTREFVRLVGPSGTVDVPLWSWPADFRSTRATDEEEGRPLTALLIGGESGRHLDRLEKIASSLGVDIAVHWPYSLRKLPSKSLPVNIDLVIYLVSHMGHQTYEATKPMVKSQGIPAALTTSAGFETTLRDELERLGLLRSSFKGEYLLPVSAPAEGRYVWQNGIYTYVEAEPEPITDDSGVASLLSALAVFAVLL